MLAALIYYPWNKGEGWLNFYNCLLCWSHCGYFNVTDEASWILESGFECCEEIVLLFLQNPIFFRDGYWTVCLLDGLRGYSILGLMGFCWIHVVLVASQQVWGWGSRWFLVSELWCIDMGGLNFVLGGQHESFDVYSGCSWGRDVGFLVEGFECIN